MTYLCETGSGALDGDGALVVNGGPDVDGLPGHVPSPVQPHPAGHRPRGQAGHPQLVLYLTVEWLLKTRNIINTYQDDSRKNVS